MKVVQHESKLEQNGLKCKIDIMIDAAEVDRLINWKFNSFKSKANMKGYRAGKIPQAVIVSKFGPSLRKELTEEMIQKSGEEALSKHKLEPMGQPNVQAEKSIVSDNEPFNFSIEFECYPVVPAFNASDLTVSTVACAIEDADIEEVVAELKANALAWKPVERAAEPGDQVTVSYLLNVKGQDHGHCEHAANIVLQPKLPEAVASSLLGSSKGDSKVIASHECSVWYPYLEMDGHHDADLDHVESMTISIQEVQAGEPVELDSTIWSQRGYAAEDMDSLRAEIRKDLLLDAQVMCEDVNYDVLRPMIIHAVDFELPESPVQEELKRLQSVNNKAEMDLEQLAKENVKLSLILRETLSHSKLEVDQQRVVQYVMSKSPVVGHYRVLYARYMLQQDRSANYWAMQVLERQLLDSILNDAAKVVDNISFSELKLRAVSE